MALIWHLRADRWHRLTCDRGRGTQVLGVVFQIHRARINEETERVG
jgi:hypothetical protein